MAASYAVKGDTFVAEKPRVCIAKLGGTQWDLAPDGKRVVVVTSVESVEAPKQEHEIVMLLNFFDELRRKPRDVRRNRLFAQEHDLPQRPGHGWNSVEVRSVFPPRRPARRFVQLVHGGIGLVPRLVAAIG
jgi:hypothetical protein